MNILYVGDVMGDPGIAVVEKVLPALRRERSIDLVIAQVENLSDGKGVRLADFKRLQKAGVDFGSGGNHIFFRDEVLGQLNDPHVPIIRPANYPAGTPGLGFKYVTVPKGKVLVVSLLGKIVGKDADKPMDNPLQVIDSILASQKDVPRVATVVNYHGDFSSEKRIIGYYLDGRVAAVVGDHWHVPTADASVLPKGTAHQTDVGMCGSLDSSLGVTFDSLIPRWRDGKVTHNILETKGRMQWNALLITVDDNTGLALGAEPIQKIFD
ncbi:MAG TPA: TIGR00282 family metallophosphoesterase [Candidatus Saccharimonadales bacterium]|jgi:metallophosphoesterase (TIGR00282 family)|nr:TIGR00282 family metallophosphoesterase [Candidatus Saccharimonadales bacterium]